jgi:hypothetical protein
MSYLRKVEMSHSLPKIRAWGANFGLGDDEQAGLTTDRSVDGGSGWQPHGGLSGSGAGGECAADAAIAKQVSRWGWRSADPQGSWPYLELPTEYRRSGVCA